MINEMKAKIRPIIISIATAFLFSLTPEADVEAHACETGGTTEIYYVNGIWNSPRQARHGLELIESAYKKSLEKQYPDWEFKFTLAYNTNYGRVRDLVELIVQKLNEINDTDTNKFEAIQYFHSYMTANAFNPIAPISMQILETAIKEYLAARITDSIDASSHIQKYQTSLLEGKRVLLIAHSQGNMFASRAMENLNESYGNSIGMISVATPASAVHGKTTYYTAHDDRVINAISKLGVLPSNLDNDPGFFNDPRDFSNHQFKESYFANGLASRAKIDEAVSRYMNSLAFPTAELGSGSITVTLTWGSEPDVDLHIIEPNGAHVYFFNKQGNSGYLDLDDTDGFGPEHYFVACNALEEGTYKIGVYYFRGSNPETAQVQITTGDGNTRTFLKELSYSLGVWGAPIYVASISVTKDQSGNYLYEVH